MNVGRLTSCIVSVSQIFADYCVARILYFITDYSLVCSAASRSQEVTAPNEDLQGVAGRPWLLRQPLGSMLEPGADPTAERNPEEGRSKQSISLSSTSLKVL